MCRFLARPVCSSTIFVLLTVVADMDRNLEPFGSIRPQVSEGEEHVVENLEKEAIFQGEKIFNFSYQSLPALCLDN